ncbi:MAG: hypothetical protein A2096_02510 [Spirochaetes bacterium GWF1_41_5]|nr:MAG: hypothetical protein A2096_02510 [Spirochaetes bacterium GWF1_41_5]HBE04538.1 thioesterase [Spirochaetia bacterium]
MEKRYKTRIYYRDTDMGGVVYYGRYLEFLEIGRTEYIRDAGMSVQDLYEKHGIISPVIEVNVRYLRPARYDDEITISVQPEKITNVKIFIKYELFNQKGDLLCVAHTVNGSIDRESFRPVRFPDEFLALWKQT